jgi:hypothetical protein
MRDKLVILLDVPIGHMLVELCSSEHSGLAYHSEVMSGSVRRGVTEDEVREGHCW